MGGIKTLVYFMLFVFISNPVFGMKVNYIDYYDYQLGPDYGYRPYFEYDLDDDNDDTYLGYRVKEEPIEYYYCKTKDGDEIGFWQECTNPFYTEGIRLSETKKTKGYNVNPGKKWDYLDSLNQPVKSIKVLFR
ncbi:hypothetical protein HOD20_04470 [archaeon]|jgi:hypothetical protein|nr:hypothetical protein [archaeon]MBT4351760.1 hypothetical protein [archaeon]MBT4647866.1 hypothetical protein [archaeon]MBT6821066.1 hypothetical protein [archaeon]MBT7392015.1 hypothetical protein [archaeon]